MAGAAPAAEKLDAICIGGSVEVLFAAASLALSGKSIVLLRAQDPSGLSASPTPCLVDIEAAQRLDLVAHGLRFGAAAPLIGVSQDRTLVLWPEQDATVAGILALSSRDAAAWPAFVHRVMRLAGLGVDVASALVPNLHLADKGRHPLLAETVFMRGASIARVLDETFETPMLKGMLCQFALEGVAVSPTLPGSARLLARNAVLSLLGSSVGKRPVAGGERALSQALNRALASADVSGLMREGRVREVLYERDAVQGIVLSDGTIMKAPHVIMSPLDTSVQELLQNGPHDSPWVGSPILPGRIVYTVSMPPSIRGASTPVLTSGASVLLNPSVDRLVRSHGAFVRRGLLQDFCLCLRISPTSHDEGRLAWEVVADIGYIPRETEEGPWSGPRREQLMLSVTKTIDAWAPGFELSLGDATLVHPVEPRGFLDHERPGLALSNAGPSIELLPDIRSEGVSRPARGLWLAGSSLSAGMGHAGMAIAQAVGSPSRMRMAFDA